MKLPRNPLDTRKQTDGHRLINFDSRSWLRLPTVALLIAFLIPAAWSQQPSYPEEPRAVLTDGHGSALWWHDSGSALLDSAGELSWEVELEPEVRWTSLALEQGAWFLAGSKGEDRLVLMKGRGDRVETMSAPRHGSKMISAPALLAGNDELLGLAWLGGDSPRALGVRSAMRRPDGWTVSTAVSPPGPGTQTALVTTTLSDGRHLLLWSAFDGTDDEIHWSIGRDGSWSRPQRLGPDRRYPDITPAVTALADGRALAAWSSYDGQVYRLVLAHFDGQQWGPRISQPSSADLFPSFTSVGSHRILQAKDPVENHWTLVEIGSQGEALQRTITKGAKPVVVTASEESIEFRSQAGSAPEHRDWTQ